jgi:hypothetical protein
MTVGRAPKHEDLFRSTRELCYSGMSDREAVDAFVFDTRWKYAAGLLDFDPPGFVHTVLVDMRERLRRSDRPNRIFATVIEAARAAGLIGRKRVIDSTALYDAVATQDTVTLVRPALVDALALDGFAALASIDPDSEIIVATDATAGAKAHVKVQPASAKKGLFAQDAFTLAGVAEFGKNCAACPLRAQCTDSIGGRTVRTHSKHDTLDRSRRAQRDPAWKQRYRSIRPKVERKLAHSEAGAWIGGWWFSSRPSETKEG